MTSLIAPPKRIPKLPEEWPQEHFDSLVAGFRQPPYKLDGLDHCQIEVTNHCDLKCVECPQRLMARPRQWMMPDVFEAILERVLMRYEFDTIIPHKDGESLLHPFHREMMATMARVHKGKFTIYTNGTHFHKEFYDFARTLPNTFEIFMSFHMVGFVSGKFEEERVKQYDTEEATRELVRCLEEPADNIRIAVSTHVTKWSDPAQCEAWKVHWDSMATRFPTQLTGVHLNTSINPWAGHIPSEVGTVSFPSCPYGDGAHIFIGVTGDVIPCCMDLNHELKIGNIMDDGMEAILAGRRQFYADVAVPEKRKPRCVTCLSGGNGGCCS